MTPHPKRSAAGGGSGRLRIAHCLTEQEPESWPGGAKPGRRRHREVELKCVRQQEDAVDGGDAFQVGKVYRVELVDERARPVIEHIGDGHVVGDAEGEVQVGEAIAAVHGKRAHGGSGNGALILFREPEQALAESIPLLDGEHGLRFYFRSGKRKFRSTGASITMRRPFASI